MLMLLFISSVDRLSIWNSPKAKWVLFVLNEQGNKYIIIIIISLNNNIIAHPKLILLFILYKDV